MNAATHIPFGAACWAGACLPLHPGPAPLLLGAVTAAAVAPWPDLDNLGAWSKRRRGLLVAWRVHPVKSRLSALVTLAGTHRRGPCHSLLVLPLVAALLLLPALAIGGWPLWLAPAAAVGLCSHPVLDLANRQPVRLFWPYGPLVYGLRLKVGGVLEPWVRTLAWAGLVIAGAAGLR